MSLLANRVCSSFFIGLLMHLCDCRQSSSIPEQTCVVRPAPVPLPRLLADMAARNLKQSRPNLGVVTVAMLAVRLLQRRPDFQSLLRPVPRRPARPVCTQLFLTVLQGLLLRRQCGKVVSSEFQVWFRLQCRRAFAPSRSGL